MKKILNTPRLYLREFTTDDAQLLVDLNSDPDVTRYTGDGEVTVEQAEEIITTIIRPQYANKIGRWAVHLSSNDEFIGWCGLKYIAELNETDLGYRFFKSHWGKGYATESAKVVLEYGFRVLKLDQVVARAAIENHASINVIQKLNFKFTGEAVEHGDRVNKFSRSASA